MKKFRPHNAGYIVVYVVVLFAIAESIWTILSTIRQMQNPQTSSMADGFFLWTLLILPVAILYGNRYRQSVVEISSTHMHIVRPALITPRPGEARASFLFRQGENDNVLIRRSFELAQLAKYGYIEAFNLRSEDKSGAKEEAKLFPVHEVAFIMKDGRNCRMNAAIYNAKQLHEIVCAIRDATNIEPTGKLAEALEAPANASKTTK